MTPTRSSEQQHTRQAGRVPQGARPRTSVITDASEVVLVTVIRAGDRVLKAFDTFFRPFGLTDAQYNVLRILEGAKEPLSQQELAKRLLVSRANVTGLIDKLEAQGLVQRCACEDRRVKLIQLTEQGLAFVEETFAALQQVCAALMHSFSSAEQRDLHRLLTKLLGSSR